MTAIQLSLEDAVEVILDSLRPPAPAISGPGWTIPDHGLSRHRPHHWDGSVRAAVEAIENGLGDQVAHWLYMRAGSSVPEWEAAFDFHLFRLELRKVRR